MIFKKVLYTLILGISVFPAFAKEVGCEKPTINVELSRLTPSYGSKSYPELVQMCGGKNVLGCTLSKYGCEYQIKLNKKGCKQLDFICYPDDFQVYIVDDYPNGSCEYKAIRKHENFHVSAFQNFSPKAIEAYLTKCIDEEVQKKKIKSGEQIYMKCSSKTQAWMNRRIQDKNREIDSYKKYDPLYFSDCKNWKMHSWEIEAHLDMKD